MLDIKLQIKAGQTIALINAPASVKLQTPAAPLPNADALLVFIMTEAQLLAKLPLLHQAGLDGKLLWIAYPKAGQLHTDVNRDSIRQLMNQNGLDPVRQVAIDETWSGLRLKRLG